MSESITCPYCEHEGDLEYESIDTDGGINEHQCEGCDKRFGFYADLIVDVGDPFEMGCQFENHDYEDVSIGVHEVEGKEYTFYKQRCKHCFKEKDKLKKVLNSTDQ